MNKTKYEFDVEALQCGQAKTKSKTMFIKILLFGDGFAQSLC